jgi:DhnA family fructose-bisphosphate aldolase class Ia
MSSAGKTMRMRRILDPATGTAVMFAISHGTSAPKVLPGIEDPRPMVRNVVEGGANVVFLARGFARMCADDIAKNNNVGLALKVSASCTLFETPFLEVQTATVEDAVELGADAVVAMIPFTYSNEPDVISWVAGLGAECDRWGMPFIAEAEFPNAYTEEASEYASSLDLEYQKHSARLCVELGADVVKANWSGSIEDFAEIVQVSNVPVVVAGGSKVSDLDALQKLDEGMRAGAIGCSVGRNIFQHKDPVGMTQAICAVVRERKSPEEAIKLVNAGARETA